MYYSKIKGHFNFEKIYDMMIFNASDNDTFVEIGCWFGKSTCYMAEKIKENKKNIKFFTIDTFKGNIGEESSTGGFLNAFENNMKNAGIEDFVTWYELKSNVAVEKFEDNSLQFLFIDGDHSYKGIKKDIELWLPKIKAGGYIGGHDWQVKDIRKAVNEFFDDDFNIHGNSWLHQKK